MIVKMAEFTVADDQVDACIEAIRTFVEAVQGEPGTLAYASHRKPDGVSFVHFMAFRDADAEAHHRHTEHVQRFVEILYPRCKVPPVFTDLEPVAAISGR